MNVLTRSGRRVGTAGRRSKTETMAEDLTWRGVTTIRLGTRRSTGRREGTTALSREHADKADNKSYTDDQLRQLKAAGKGRGRDVAGRFDWMRREMVALIGGNAYYEIDNLIMMDLDPVVWFSTNANGGNMINFRMPTQPGQDQRAALIDNFWLMNPKGASAFECPLTDASLRFRTLTMTTSSWYLSVSTMRRSPLRSA